MHAVTPTLSRMRPAPLHNTVVAIITVAAALLLALLFSSLSFASPFLFFYAAVAVSAWYGGLSGGLLATALSLGAAGYLLLAPLGVRATDPDIIFRLASFALVSSLVSALSEARLRERDLAMQAREQSAYLSNASQILARSLDYTTTLKQVADLAVPSLGDWCVIDILGGGGQLDLMAAAHRNPEKVRWAYELRAKYPVDPASPVGAPHVIRTGTAELYAEIPDKMLEAVARSPEELDILRAVGYRSLMIVPLRVGGRAIGAISFVVAESARRYGPADLVFAQEVADRAAVAIDNARLYTQARHDRAIAEQAVRARDDFLSVAAHELKTPLTSLQLQAQMMERRADRAGGMGARDRQAVQVMVEQMRRLDRLISTLLDISRLEHGQLLVRRDRLDLDALSRRTIGEIQPISEIHPIGYSLLGNPPIVEGDELRLEQVLQNLLYNAIKYSPAGGPIGVRLESGAGRARLSVTDVGIGIPQEAIPHLFTQFYRAANASPRHISGMGIGLYVVREIVRLHHGSVAVSSVEGEGCTFTVVLPCV